MKTVDEKALEIVRKWREGTYHNECQANAALQVAIIEALKRQDHDTRHACAEAAMKAAGNHNAYEVGVACVNVKAV